MKYSLLCEGTPAELGKALSLLSELDLDTFVKTLREPVVEVEKPKSGRGKKNEVSPVLDDFTANLTAQAQEEEEEAREVERQLVNVVVVGEPVFSEESIASSASETRISGEAVDSFVENVKPLIAKSEEPKAEYPKITHEDLKALAQRKAAEGKKEGIRALLAEFSAEAITKVPQESLSAFHVKLSAL